MLEQNLFKYLGYDYILSDTFECFRPSDIQVLIEKAVLEHSTIFWVIQVFFTHLYSEKISLIKTNG